MKVFCFSEIRNDLVTIMARPMGPWVLGAITNTLEELKELRERWFSSPPIVDDKEILVPTLSTESDYCPETKIEPVIVRRTRPSTVPAEPPIYNSERYLPYRILWAKVIVRAAYDYALWKDSKDLRLKKFAEDSERWLYESSDLELSFENICFAFNFPVERIRQKTRTLTRDDVKKLEFRERHGRYEILGEITGGEHR